MEIKDIKAVYFVGAGGSTATISRVKKCLNYGADGYKLVLERLNKKNK